jgi:site-specific DNA recombinase
MKNRLKTIILSRVSTEEQKEAGNSIPAQTSRLKKYCHEKQLQIWKTFEFDETAYKSKRRDFGKIVKLIQEEGKPIALCCDKIDRLLRNFTRELVLFEELRQQGKLELHFPSDNIILHKDSPAADLFRFTMGVSLAKYYSDTISDNVKRANEQKLRRGEWPGKAPIGYINIDLENDKKWIEPDPPKAELIIKMFELYATSEYSMFLLRKRLIKEGVFESAGLSKHLSKSMIDNILKNPFYYGTMRYKEQLHPHKYKPLISKELFTVVQEIKASWNKKPFKYASKPFAYRGLLSCAHCGCRITFEIQKGKYIYGHCTNYYKNCKEVAWVKEQEITDQVVDILKKFSLNKETLQMLLTELKKNHQYKSDYHKQIMANLKTQYDKIQNRIEKMYEDKLDGSITQEMNDNMLTKFKEQQEGILDNMDKHNDADQNYYFKASNLLKLAQNAHKLFESAQIEQKRKLFNFVFQNSMMRGKKLELSMKTPFDTMLLCHETNNWLPGLDSNQ